MIDTIIFDLKNVLFSTDSRGELVPILEGTKLVEQLARQTGPWQVRLLVLSNISPELLAFLLHKYVSIMSCFEGIIHPANAGARKPSHEIFHYVCNEHDVDPVTTVFIDDQEINLQAAKTLGMSTILWDSPEQVYAKLELLGALKKTGE